MRENRDRAFAYEMLLCRCFNWCISHSRGVLSCICQLNTAELPWQYVEHPFRRNALLSVTRGRGMLDDRQGWMIQVFAP